MAALLQTDLLTGATAAGPAANVAVTNLPATLDPVVVYDSATGDPVTLYNDRTTGATAHHYVNGTKTIGAYPSATVAAPTAAAAADKLRSIVDVVRFDGALGTAATPTTASHTLRDTTAVGATVGADGNTYTIPAGVIGYEWEILPGTQVGGTFTVAGVAYTITDTELWNKVTGQVRADDGQLVQAVSCTAAGVIFVELRIERDPG